MLLWLTSNLGVILNKAWDESCSNLFVYLLIMSFICIGGVIIYLYLGIVRYGTYTQWLLMSLLGAVCSILLTLFMGWGGVRLVNESGLLGVDQCFDCMYTNGTAVVGECEVEYPCLPSSWRVITDITECTPLLEKNIDCEMGNLCYYSAPNTFMYSVVVTGMYLLVLLFNGGIIFTQMIPSLLRQSAEHARLI